jgi:hypothetical protein
VVEGQALGGLILVKGLKGAGQDDPAKVPQNGSNVRRCH